LIVLGLSLVFIPALINKLYFVWGNFQSFLDILLSLFTEVLCILVLGVVTFFWRKIDSFNVSKSVMIPAKYEMVVQKENKTSNRE